MDEVKDLDASAEAEGQRLLAAAFETATVDAELLPGVRRRIARRRRTRTLVPAGAVAVAAAAVTVAALLSASVAVAPSAQAAAAVAAAAMKTSAESFQVSVVQTAAETTGGHVGKSVLISGEFDPRRELGHERVSFGDDPPVDLRFIGDHLYTSLPPGNGLSQGKPWVKSSLVPVLSQTKDGATIAAGFNGDQPIDPGELLGLLTSTSSVRQEGPASGPGWAGTRYAFTVRLPQGADYTIAGTVDVDRHARVRHLVTTITDDKLVLTLDETFDEFGVRVSVPVPPANQVDNLGKQRFTLLFYLF